MIKVIVRVKDKSRISELSKYGTLVYKSPILNIATLEIKKEYLKDVEQDDNIISCEEEHKGSLMLV
ncbi:Nitrogen regulatory protein P-II [Bacillus sp. IT-13CA1]